MSEETTYVTVNGTAYPLQRQISLKEALERYSPFGTEPVLATLGDVTFRSIDDVSSVVLQPGDHLDIFPLIIGG